MSDQPKQFKFLTSLNKSKLITQAETDVLLSEVRKVQDEQLVDQQKELQKALDGIVTVLSDLEMILALHERQAKERIGVVIGLLGVALLASVIAIVLAI